MTSASSIEKPWSSEAVRQGASPTAQSTSATSPHDVVMIVPDASLEPGRGAGRLDAAHESRRGERVQGVIHGLKGDMADTLAHPGGDRLDAEVVTARTTSSSATRAAVTRRPAPRNSPAGAGVWDAVLAPNLPSQTQTIQDNERSKVSVVPGHMLSRCATRHPGG
jgi:hypothetical protein